MFRHGSPVQPLLLRLYGVMSRNRSDDACSGSPNGSMVATRMKLNGLIWSSQLLPRFQAVKGRRSRGELTLMRLRAGLSAVRWAPIPYPSSRSGG